MYFNVIISALTKGSLFHTGRDVEVDSNGSGSKEKEQPAGESNEEEADGLDGFIPHVKHAVDALRGHPKGINYFDKKNPVGLPAVSMVSPYIGPATDRTDGAIKQEVILFTA